MVEVVVVVVVVVEVVAAAAVEVVETVLQYYILDALELENNTFFHQIPSKNDPKIDSSGGLGRRQLA